MIEVVDLGVARGGRRLLAGVALEVVPGRVTALLGPNGAGKSTLLRAICGDVTPECGTVWFDGRPLVAWSRRELAKRRAALLQESALAFPFSVLDVVLMGRAPHHGGGERPADLAIARAALARVDAAGLSARAFPTLSGGEKQRVNFARALAQIWTPPGEGPRYLLLDEPTASLDPRHQHLVMRMVSRLAAAGVGVLVILHDVNLASRYADDAVLLKGGSVVARGAVDTVLREDCLATAFDLPMRALTVPGLAQPIIIAVDSNEAEPRVDGGRRS